MRIKVGKVRKLPELQPNMQKVTVESTMSGWLTMKDEELTLHALTAAVCKRRSETGQAQSLSDNLVAHFKRAHERPATNPNHYPESGTEEEKERWQAHEAREWIRKLMPLYAEEVNWQKPIDAFRNATLEKDESSQNFLTRLKGLWGDRVGDSRVGGRRSSAT